ncbi:MAG: hypothetical protein AAF623_21060 [Planctomycetota bacterium]
MLTGARGSVATMIPVFLLILIVASGMIIVILKPIRSERSRDVARSIRPATEPVLTDIIYQVADGVASARPGRIEVNYEFKITVETLGRVADTSASNLYLRIGLPVLASHCTEHFTTALATKLGLYSKKHNDAKMIFVRNVVDWLNRTAYEMDSWDANVERMLKSQRFKVVNRLLAQTQKFAFFVLVRLPFRLLHALAKLLCSKDLGRQELNADAIAVAIHGPKTFEAFLLEHQNLDVAQKSAMNDFVDSIETKYVVNNIFEVMSLKRKYLNEFQLEDVKNEIESGKTRSFHSENSDLARIRECEGKQDQSGDYLISNTPVKNHVHCYQVLANQCTEDLRSYLKQRLVADKAGKKTSKSRRERADEINRYVKNALREGIRSNR